MSEEGRPTLDADRLLDVLDGVGVCVFVKDLDGRFVYLNRACAEVFDRTPEAMLGGDGSDVAGEEMVSAWRAQDLHVLESGAPLDFEESAFGRIFLTHKVPLVDPEGRAVAVIGVSSDITERKRGEERVARRAAELAEAQVISGVGSWNWDAETGEVTWSPELRRILGLDPGSHAAGSEGEPLAFVHPTDRDRVTAAAQAALDGAEPLDLDLRIVRADGAERIVHCRAEVTLRPDGAPDRLGGTLVDVTDRRHAEVRLAEAQRLAQLGSWDRDLELDEVTWSEEMYRIFGVDPEHFLPSQESVLELVVPEDRERLAGDVDVARSSEGAFDSFVRVRRPDGEIRELRVRGAVHSSPGNGPMHMLGICQDLTDIRANERALAEAVELFRSTFERAPVAMGLVGLDGRFELANDALCEFLGRSAEELCKLSVADVTHPDERAETAEGIRGMLAEERSERSAQKRFVRPDGGHRWGALRSLVVRDADGRPLHFLGILVDVTERRRAERRRAALHDVASAMALGGPLHVALLALLEGIGSSLGWTRGAVWLVDPDGGRLRREESWPREPHGGQTLGRGDGLPGRAWETAAAVSEEVELAFPLVSGPDVVGVMVFCGPEVCELDDELTALAGALGSQIGEFVVRKRSEAQLLHQAVHDPLTGLPNRILFFDRLDHAIIRMRRGPAPLAVLFLDFDGFKAVNDRFGHEGGDEALRRAADRVSRALRAEDTVGRFGGDELVILTEHVAGPGAAQRMAERILAELAAPLELQGEALELSASIGICIASGPDQTREELLRAADAAMYSAKAAGGGRFVISS
ncbi:MAG TPA: PAS domain S-box protein [Solirubrobacteraceae bacterium]|nr:PAS domain S-box protein [Solirubrobacteraceae bacterium]